MLRDSRSVGECLKNAFKIIFEFFVVLINSKLFAKNFPNFLKNLKFPLKNLFFAIFNYSPLFRESEKI